MIFSIRYLFSPLLKEVNDVLMDVFGYCIVPINYAIRKNLFDKKGNCIHFVPSSISDSRTNSYQHHSK